MDVLLDTREAEPLGVEQAAFLEEGEGSIQGAQVWLLRGQPLTACGAGGWAGPEDARAAERRWEWCGRSQDSKRETEASLGLSFLSYDIGGVLLCLTRFGAGLKEVSQVKQVPTTGPGNTHAQESMVPSSESPKNF